ncbi:hypothetical protein L1049_021146 [Liquidambar formosana]|uniref:Uncharacterized protein n=1 Tax=Liquidambar formosana TaxID=63359 RepID=A0AAP0SCF3_LIQFO
MLPHVIIPSNSFLAEVICDFIVLHAGAWSIDCESSTHLRIAVGCEPVTRTVTVLEEPKLLIVLAYRHGFIDRMKNMKHSLLHEASLDSTGIFASRLRLLFGDDE